VLTEWFSDGLYVVRADSAYSHMLGRRVTGIGSKSIDEVAAALADVIPKENPAQLLNRMPSYLMMPEVLAALSITDSPDSAVFILEPGVPVPLAARAPTGTSKWVSALGRAGCAFPLYMQKPDSSYWWAYLEDQSLVYVQYRRCSQIEGRPFARFAEEFLDFAESKAARKVVIDLRLNGGGNSAVARPMVEGIAKRPRVNRKGHLFVLVGRRTYSSAILNALELKSETEATFAGEPTGGRPNHFGEVRFFQLPNSGVVVTYSTKYFAWSGEDAAWFVPDIDVRASFADYISCRDPVLERILILE
jgi:hypothetical protein